MLEALAKDSRLILSLDHTTRATVFQLGKKGFDQPALHRTNSQEFGRV